MIVVDTNVLAELVRGPHPAVVGWWRSIRPEALASTTITRAEVRLGLAILPEGRRKDELAEEMAQAFARIPSDRWLAFDNAAADRYGDLVARRERIGRPIGVADAQIASIAYVHGATLATRNVKDFEDCGIRLVDPFG